MYIEKFILTDKYSKTLSKTRARYSGRYLLKSKNIFKMFMHFMNTYLKCKFFIKLVQEIWNLDLEVNIDKSLNKILKNFKFTYNLTHTFTYF